MIGPRGRTPPPGPGRARRPPPGVPVNPREIQRVIGEFREVMRAVHAKRTWREPIDIEREIAEMHEVVNVVRMERGRPPASLDLVRACDAAACGHVDYALKFPLYCAELALELGRHKPTPVNDC